MTNQSPKIERAVLVYQAGIANVFAVECFNSNPFGRNAKRLLQADFRSCENFARGLGTAGVQVASAGCNMAGNVVNQPWSWSDFGPFRDQASPVFANMRERSAS